MCTISNVLIHLVLGTSFTDDSFAGNRPAPAAYLTITQSYQLHSRVLSILSPSLPLSTSSIVMVFTRSYSMWAASLLGSRIKGNLIISYPKIFFFTHLLEKNEKKKEKKIEKKRREEKRKKKWTRSIWKCGPFVPTGWLPTTLQRCSKIKEISISRRQEQTH